MRGANDDQDLAKLNACLGATRGGEQPQSAFTRIFAIEPKQLQADLVKYGERKLTYSRLKRRSAAETPAMQISVLPPSADDLMFARAAMEIGVDEDRQAATLAQVRSSAAKYGDDFSRRVLARAEALYGDGGAADRILDPILTASPKDAEALYLKGMRWLVAACKETDKSASLAKQAQTWFARAHKADQNDFPTLVRYVEAELYNGPPSDNTVEVLLLAHELAPQVVEVTMNATSMLLARNHYEEAANLVAPLASDPHNPSLAAAAKRLLERARAGDKKDEAPAPATQP